MPGVDSQQNQPHALMQSVLAARARGDWHAVVRCCEERPRDVPLPPPLLDAAAEACGRVGQLERAERLARELCEAAPESPLGFIRLARLASEQSDLRATLRRWDEAAERFPKNPTIVFGRVRAWLLAGDTEPAISACRELVASNPESVPAWRELLRALALGGAHAERDAVLEAILQRRPAKAELLVAAGDCLLKSRRHEEAAACFGRIEREFPELPLGPMGLAAVAEGRQDWDGALAAWERAREMFPGHLPATLGLASARAHVGQFELARQLLDELGEPERGSLAARMARATLSMREGDHEGAAEAWRRVLEIAPRNEKALSQHGVALACCKRFDEAIGALERARIEAPRSFVILSALSDAHRLRGDLRGALRWRIRAVRAAPGPAIGAPALVRDLLGLGRVAAARSVTRCLREGSPADPEALQAAAVLSELCFEPAAELRTIDEMPPELSASAPVARLRRAAQTQLGELEGAANTGFALAISPRFSRAEVHKRLAALEATLAGIDREGPADEGSRRRYAETLRDVHEAVPRPKLLKMAPLDDTFAEVLRCVQERVARPAELVAYVDAHLDQVKRGTRQAPVIGAVLYQQQRALRQLGRETEALAVLRDALPYLPREGVPYHEYLALYRGLVPRLQTASVGRIGVLVVSCRRYLHRALALRCQLETETRLRPLIVVASGEAGVAAVDDGILTVPCDDEYEGLPRKMALAYEYLRIASNWRGVLKIDDDVFVRDPARFEALIAELGASTYDYAGRIVAAAGGGTYHFGKCRDPRVNFTPAASRWVHYCDGGFGYYLSRRSLLAITRLSACFPGYIDGALYEDAMVGELVRDAELTPQHVALDVRGAYSADSFEALRLARVLDE